MFGGDSMMQDLMVGSGWLGLLGCMILGVLASVVLGTAGRRRVQGRPWAVPGVVGGLLLAAAVASALSSFGTFFGFVGIAFAVFMGIGAWNAFTTPARAAERLREQEAHAERLGAAYARGAATGPPAPHSPDAAEPGQAPAHDPDWYPATPGGGPR